MLQKFIALTAMGALLASTPVSAQLTIYPAKGQSVEQQQIDEGECYAWAKGQSGYDPLQASQYAASGQQRLGGERIGGAARGAAGGAAIGAIAGDAGKGAAIGAVSGTMLGGVRQRQKRASNDQAAAQQQQHFQRAYAACFEGRGYTLK
ncbi:MULTISPECIES: glycine zipper family protein [Nitrosomonas]|uniref:YmgG-like glycine-zipper protein n=1 Tax=Nitrosomonas communis TaxID=44574 RepID=A0A0F7KGQ9_9PROT|nr:MULTISPECIES: glycine zipper family protein [Nitrosomonas]AKH37999.1 hypothetical protein AAW31_09530 [Nitrosomonas communis]TYP91610.1 YmgG-like glycine-zipper protein [Nitrosomonas communis]UVS59886.1 YMGG-like glycine zipper-containing protein [Nitrosomonas sp. PLL12]